MVNEHSNTPTLQRSNLPPDPFPGRLRTWWVAARPFSLPASLMPAVAGTTMALALGGAHFDFWGLVLTALTVALMHAGANVLGDRSDFIRGLDREVLPVSGAVVRGWVAPPQAARGALAFFGLGALAGLGLVWRGGGLPLLLIGLGGAVLGVFYTLKPLELKYRAWGDLAVFLAFGVLITEAAWTVQTGAPSWRPALWSVPLGLLIIAILHANNWRDIRGDTEHRARTVAALLGDGGSLAYYRVLLVAPFVWVTLLVLAGVLGPCADRWKLPLATLGIWLAWPQALKRLRIAAHRTEPERQPAFLMLDGITAQFNLVFGLLYAATFLLVALWR